MKKYFNSYCLIFPIYYIIFIIIGALGYLFLFSSGDSFGQGLVSILGILFFFFWLIIPLNVFFQSPQISGYLSYYLVAFLVNVFILFYFGLWLDFFSQRNNLETNKKGNYKTRLVISSFIVILLIISAVFSNIFGYACEINKNYDNSNDKDECYSQLGSSRKDISLCNRIVEGSLDSRAFYHKGLCYGKIAKVRNDESLCGTLNNSGDRDSCYLISGFSKNDCSKLTSPVEKKYCESSSAGITR